MLRAGIDPAHSRLPRCLENPAELLMINSAEPAGPVTGIVFDVRDVRVCGLCYPGR